MSAERAPERRAGVAGRVGTALVRLLTKRATVVASEKLSDGFRLITLEGPALAGVVWRPGQKAQIMMGSGLAARTYTPIEWNASAGRACILGYAHGDGPGSAWLRAADPGMSCDIFGPRASLDTAHLAGPLALFGDETSVGLAYALAHQDPVRSVICHFEAGDVETVGQIAAQLGLPGAALFARREDDAHLPEMIATLSSLADAGASFVLTGKAGTIGRLRQALRQRAVPSGRVVTKAYWAPGKIGLD